jgi:hypothetical protein
MKRLFRILLDTAICGLVGPYAEISGTLAKTAGLLFKA